MMGTAYEIGELVYGENTRLVFYRVDPPFTYSGTSFTTEMEDRGLETRYVALIEDSYYNVPNIRSIAPALQKDPFHDPSQIEAIWQAHWSPARASTRREALQLHGYELLEEEEDADNTH